MADGRGIRIMGVQGVGKVSLISMVDGTSRLKAERYPSLQTTNPSWSDSPLTVRRVFFTYGMPATLTLDHGTVCYDITTPSPVPTRLHVWVLADGEYQCASLGLRCPPDHAIVERTHQTRTAQALLGQTYPSHAADVGQAWMNADRSSTAICLVARSPTKPR